jgi:hypothetical protein
MNVRNSMTLARPILERHKLLRADILAVASLPQIAASNHLTNRLKRRTDGTEEQSS